MDKISVFRCIINVKIGEINNRKREIIVDRLGEKFPNRGVSPDGLSLFMNNAMDGTAITINHDQIVYIDQKKNSTDLGKMKETINTMFDILILDEIVNASINLISNDEFGSKNCMEKSKILLNDRANDFLSEFSGFGYRAFFNYKEMLSEIRVEPLLTNIEKLYIEAIYNLKSVNYQNLAEESTQAYKDFEEKLTKFSSVLL